MSIFDHRQRLMAFRVCEMLSRSFANIDRSFDPEQLCMCVRFRRIL